MLHENVVRTIDCDALENHDFLVMDFEGRNLRVNREILAAWREELGEGSSGDR